MRSVLEILNEDPETAGPDLITLEDLKTALVITDSSNDARLSAAITMQSRILTEYCNRRLGRATALETFSLEYRESMWPIMSGPYGLQPALSLSLYPVAEILELSIASATADTATYRLDPQAGLLWLINDFGVPFWAPTTLPAEIMVVYDGGYELPAQAPAMLQRAVIESVASVGITQGGGVRDPTIAEVQHGDTRVRYVTPAFASGAISAGQHLSPSVADLIAPYRRLSIA
jgi:Phage gp6-like head-tail connector protein